MAAQEFASHGFQGTSYNQLLERLQIGKSSAYYYFDDKRDLFLTVVERCYAAYFETIQQLAPPTSAAEFWTFVEQRSLAGFRLMLRDPTIAALMQCMDREQALLGELDSERIVHDQRKFYEGLLEQGQRLGAVRVDLPLALLADVARSLAISFDRWFVVAWYKPDFMGLEAAAKAFCDVVRRACEPPGTHAD